MSHALDQYDMDETYRGPCEGCGEDVFADPLLGERPRYIGSSLVCLGCWHDIAQDMDAWGDYDARGNE